MEESLGYYFPSYELAGPHHTLNKRSSANRDRTGGPITAVVSK